MLIIRILFLNLQKNIVISNEGKNFSNFITLVARNKLW